MKSLLVHWLVGVGLRCLGCGSTAIEAYDENLVKRQLNLTQASYCVTPESPVWACGTCSEGVTLEAVVQDEGHLGASGALALVGFDSCSSGCGGKGGALFVSYRGSSNVENWLENIKVVKTGPYSDMPDVKVEDGFWQWYKSLKAGVDAALLAASLKHANATEVSVSGHSAGGAAATLHAFDLTRGDAHATAQGKLRLRQLVTFGSPRVGNEDFFEAFEQLINETAVPSWRVTHWHDTVPHVIPEAMGFHHVATEVWYNEASSTRLVCDESGEDPKCSNTCGPFQCTSIPDHLDYLNTSLGLDGC